MNPTSFQLKNWWRGSKCDVELSEHELEVLANYEAEVERGLMHTPLWQQRMAQLERLRDAKEREEAGL